MCELWTKAVEIMRENPSVWAGFFSAFVLCGVLVICLKIKRKISVWCSFQYAVIIIGSAAFLPFIHAIEAISDFLKVCEKIFKGEV